MTGQLQERAMLVSLSISRWTARKTDKRVNAEVAERAQAAASVGNYRKDLMPDEALDFLQTQDGLLRKEHYKRTLPWDDDGFRILTSAGYFEYMRIMRGLKHNFEEAANVFLTKYPQYVLDAKKKLGGLYSPEDYPDVSVVAGKFSVSIKVKPLPSGDDFRAKLPDGELSQIKLDIERDVRSTFEAAQRDVYERMRDTLSHMVDRLTEYKPGSKGSRATGTFRDSMVGNVKELVGVLPSLNVAGDPAVDTIAAEVAKLMQGVEAKDLRDNHVLRQSTAREAKAILQRVNSYFGPGDDNAKA